MRTLIALLLVAELNLTSAVLAESADLTPDLIDARLSILRASGMRDTDETLRAYETAQDWLNQAASHSRDADNYADALTSAPKREAEVQARIDALDATEAVSAEMAILSRRELEAQLAHRMLNFWEMPIDYPASSD